MIAIIDYGVGNLFSIQSALSFLKIESIVTSNREEIMKADKIILPGVGAFKDASKKLFSTGLAEIIQNCAEKGTPLLGICLGMQLLFEKSYEYGEYQGLNLISGTIDPLEKVISSSLKIPHIGWNKLDIKKEDKIFKYVTSGESVYFVHSYYGTKCDESTLATSEYDIDVTAVVKSGNVYGMQFHPEKSGETGLRLLKGFSEV